MERKRTESEECALIGGWEGEVCIKWRRGII